MATALLYGAYGYTGELTARFAKARGMRLVLSGRDPGRTAEVAQRWGMDHRVFGLDDPRALDDGLRGVDVVLHCAGPFSRTSKPMVDACLRNRVHYLDITGEIDVFEACAARDAEARAAGVMLLPGVGFDVVPSDCLAAHLKERLPDATHLALAFFGLSSVSHGTATTMVESLHQGGRVRRDGKIVSVPPGSLSRTVDFGYGRPRATMAIPWGDVSTAFHSTGIPNIEVYFPARRATRVGARAIGLISPIVASGPVQRLLKRAVDARPAGPTDEQRAKGSSFLWGEVRNERGDVRVSRLKTPEGYTLTADASLTIVKRVLEGDRKVGYQTPASVYGPELVMSLDGVSREDL
ncbi:MAG: saccharopine dehydrogenase NADP-binding domain-containing protein [Deltaproteobacteria bacterium]|nr:saccharopine dehydrogenase NADP-binding domain-containing protein [Deltaproteobacteria bacterium]